MQKLLEEDLARIDKWLNINKLKLNLDKTKFMILNYSGNKPDFISFGSQKIGMVNFIKYLGIIIDDNLSMGLHVDYVYKKVAKKLGL